MFTQSPLYKFYCDLVILSRRDNLPASISSESYYFALHFCADVWSTFDNTDFSFVVSDYLTLPPIRHRQFKL